ncbi:Uncharacterized conserved protein [Solimonas aquatica]|uniref:Uncharacterized conserved protein n=1 Tax=Solimonas aquatica TaxID=489703 RepID=A0A1H9JFL2_9GAMM|nr:GFA family protein [Solimonas aquatica]SEQ85626.1 Uncharacterized conserved protein [Solimonas aquatica]
MHDSRHTGSCLCGEVLFEVQGEFERFYLCHCSYCRKDSGSAHGANLFSSSARLRWLSGEDRVSVFTLPGTRHARAFCSRCGSALPRLAEPGQLVVPAGSLDSPLRTRPDAHLFMASKADWDEALEHVPGLPGFPAS